MRFKLDTGGEASEKTYQQLRKPTLTHPRKVLYRPSRTTLKVLGQFKGKLHYKDKIAGQTICVVDRSKTNLLRLPAISALNLAVRVDIATTSAMPVDIKEGFASLCRGLGEEYHIKLQEIAKPHAIFTPRHVPLPLRTKVQQELDKMEQMGVISKVDEPALWCVGWSLSLKRMELSVFVSI